MDAATRQAHRDDTLPSVVIEVCRGGTTVHVARARGQVLEFDWADDGLAERPVTGGDGLERAPDELSDEQAMWLGRS